MAPSKQPQPAVIGIDFGSSKCCVAAVHDGRVLVFENEFGQRTTPSCVAFNSQQRLVGGAALDQAVLNWTNTVHAVKRTLGRTCEELQACHSDDESASTSVERILSFPQGCTSVDGRAGINVHYRDDKMVLFPEEIATASISKMKSIAETKLGCPVEGAVISVPTCFNNAQRKAITIAAETTGLKDVALINETTAAVLAYASNSNFCVEETVLVVDFGAGKLDVALCCLGKGSVEVKATSGDPGLGGYDLDMRLLLHVVDEFQKTSQIDLRNNIKALLKLLKACEHVKKTLFLLPEATLNVDNLVEEMDFNMKITTNTFTQLVRDVHDHILKHIRRCCSLHELQLDDVDKVLCVGGSSRLVGFEKFLSRYFKGKITKTVYAEECVAIGAALKAAILSGFEEIPSVSMKEITSYGIKLATDTGEVTGLIPKGIKIPHRGKVKVENQDLLLSFEISRKCCSEVSCVGYDVRSMGCFVPFTSCCEVEYAVDSNGILRMCLNDDQNSGHFFGELRFSEDHEFQDLLKQRTDKFDADFNKETERVKTLVELEELAYYAKRNVEEHLKKQIVSVQEQCNDIVRWIENNPNASRKACSPKNLKLKRLLKKHRLKKTA
ncbi:Heat shock protein 70 family [Trinorchestia longiramus]|nr:Heat shock protein 70 family [Trinorchestia longiramus]